MQAADRRQHRLRTTGPRVLETGRYRTRRDRGCDSRLVDIQPASEIHILHAATRNDALHDVLVVCLLVQRCRVKNAGVGKAGKRYDIPAAIDAEDGYLPAGGTHSGVGHAAIRSRSVRRRRRGGMEDPEKHAHLVRRDGGFIPYAGHPKVIDWRGGSRGIELVERDLGYLLVGRDQIERMW